MKKIIIEKYHLEGIKQITAPSWDGEIYQMSRLNYLQHKGSNLFKQVGTYIIYADHFNKQSFGNHIYIGQGDDIGERLLSHTKSKKFWNQALFLTSNWMNIAHAFNIENEFIETARIAGRYAIDNDASGQTKKLGTEDKIKCDEYIRDAKNVIALANIDIFNANIDGIFSYSFGKHGAHLKINDADKRQVQIIANSEMLIHRECSELLELIKSGRVTRKAHCIYLFTENVEMQIDMSRILPELLGVHVKNFKDACGVNASEKIEAIRSLRVQPPGL